MTKSSAEKYTDPELRDQIKEGVRAGDKGGKPGQWSARKAQMMANEYKSRGGSYIGPKDSRAKHLDQWTREDWQTKDGDANASGPDGVSHRYLPKKAWEKMGEAEKEETERRKVEGSLKREQFVGNTEKAVEARKEVGEQIREEMEQEQEQGRGKIVGGGGEMEHEDTATKQGEEAEEGAGGVEKVLEPNKRDAPGGGKSMEMKTAKQHFTPKTHKVNQPKEHPEPTKGSESKKQERGGVETVEGEGEEVVEEPADDGSGEYKPENEGDLVTEEVEVPTVKEADTMDDENMTHSEFERILDAEETTNTTTYKGTIGADVDEEAEYSPDIEVIEDEEYVGEGTDEGMNEGKGQQMLEGKVSKPGAGVGSGKHAGDKREASSGGGKVHDHEAVDCPRTEAGQTEQNDKGNGKQVFKPKKQKTSASQF